MGGQCLSLASYVTVTGTRDGATAAGGPFMLPSLSASSLNAVPAAPAGGGVRGWGRDGLGTGEAWGSEGAEGVDVDYAQKEPPFHGDVIPRSTSLG
jgi:hypothetical protein